MDIRILTLNRYAVSSDTGFDETVTGGILELRTVLWSVHIFSVFFYLMSWATSTLLSTLDLLSPFILTAVLSLLFFSFFFVFHFKDINTES